MYDLEISSQDFNRTKGKTLRNVNAVLNMISKSMFAGWIKVHRKMLMDIFYDPL